MNIDKIEEKAVNELSSCLKKFRASRQATAILKETIKAIKEHMAEYVKAYCVQRGDDHRTPSVSEGPKTQVATPV